MDHRSVVNRAVRAAVQGHGRARVIRPKSPAPCASCHEAPARPVNRTPVSLDYPAGESILCDHAVFTSVRSPTGEGYRIIAASGGVRRDEKTEITQRSPSHGGLTGDDAGLIGLLAYRMASDRACISVCRFAGTEHTARGGRRIHTHAVLLDDQTFAWFGYNAIRVMASVLRATSQPMTQTRASSVPGLTLVLPASSHAPIGNASTNQGHLIEHVMCCLLDHNTHIVTGCPSPWSCIETALDLVPHGLRRGRSLMADLAYASSRQADVAMLDRIAPETLRSLRGRNVQCSQASEPDSPSIPDMSPWLKLVTARLDQGRSRELCHYVARLGPATTVDGLNRLAKLCSDLESAASLDEPARIALCDSYRGFEPRHDVERELLEQIRAHTQPPASNEQHAG